MTTAQIRDHTWHTIRHSLNPLRRDILHAITEHPNSTAHNLASILQLDISTIRPRLTELQQSGLITPSGHAPTPFRRPSATWLATTESAWEAYRQNLPPAQPQLPLKTEEKGK